MFSIWEVAWSQAQLPQTEGRSFLSPYRWPSLLKPHEIGHHPPALHTGRTDSAGLSWTMTEGPWQGGAENRVLIPSLSHGHEPLAAFQQSANARCPQPGFQASLPPIQHEAWAKVSWGWHPAPTGSKGTLAEKQLDSESQGHVLLSVEKLRKQLCSSLSSTFCLSHSTYSKVGRSKLTWAVMIRSSVAET